MFLCGGACFLLVLLVVFLVLFWYGFVVGCLGGFVLCVFVFGVLVLGWETDCHFWGAFL